MPLRAISPVIARPPHRVRVKLLASPRSRWRGDVSGERGKSHQLRQGWFQQRRVMAVGPGRDEVEGKARGVGQGGPVQSLFASIHVAW